MKTSHIILALLVVIAGTAFTACHYQHKLDTQLVVNQSVMSMDSLESRIFDQYGEGDAGVEEMLYLKTGIHQDFMGTPDSINSRAINHDYFINCSDKGTIVYSLDDKFVTYVPYDSCSLWDNAIDADNL